MSNMFEVKDDELSAFLQNQRNGYAFNNNVLDGFKQAAARNQLMIALTYMGHVIDILEKEIEELKTEKNTDEQKKDQAGKSPRRNNRGADDAAATKQALDISEESV